MEQDNSLIPYDKNRSNLEKVVDTITSTYGTDMLKQISDYVNQYQSSGDRELHEYIMHVLFPQFAPPQRVPEIFPMPTGILRVNEIITTGADEVGNFDIAYIPQEELDENRIHIGTENSSLLNTYNVIQHKVVGNSSPGTFSQVQRLISAYIQIEYIGKLDDLQGFWQAGYEFAATNSVSSSHTRLQDAATLISLGTVQDMHHFQQGKVGERITIVHLPVPGQDDWHHPTSESMAQAKAIYYIQFRGVPVNAAAFKVNICEQWEYVPSILLKDWIVTDNSKKANVDPQKAQQAINEITKGDYKPIQKGNQSEHWYNSLWSHAKKLIGSGLIAGSMGAMKSRPILGTAMNLFGNSLYGN